MSNNKKPNKVTYRIHPAIGIARVGNSPNDIYLAPEKEGALPILCDNEGNAILDSNGKEQTTTAFKDDNNCIKRQAARFRIYEYSDKYPHGKELQLGDTIQGQGPTGKLLGIEWTVYMANKKASWYQFHQLEGEHGYADDHPMRNAEITGGERQNLIIDPGSQTVYGGSDQSCNDKNKPKAPNNFRLESAAFTKGENPHQSQSFPPELQPDSIDTLGSINTVKTNDDQIRLIVRGGHGNSGTYLSNFPGPIIKAYANNPGWFDDVSDGPVSAKLVYFDEDTCQMRYQAVDPAWIIVGYPSYAPQIVDMVTMDDVVYDGAVRNFAYDTYLYGRRNSFQNPEKIDTDNKEELLSWQEAPKTYNPDYYPYFYKEIWPILQRPYYMQYVTNIFATSNDPHEIGEGGDFQLDKVSVPPTKKTNPGGEPDPIIEDPYKWMRVYIYEALRRPGEENTYLNTRADYELNRLYAGENEREEGARNAIYGKPLMPLLFGDNPLSNTLPSKFLALTDTMLFKLKQWAEGKFINEKDEDLKDTQFEQPVKEGEELDRGVLANGLGGAFCPGGEVTWIIRNPSIYSGPFRINPNLDYLPNLTSRTVSTTPGVTAEFLPPSLNYKPQSLVNGLEPGDITKYSALPWQSDFNECADQKVDVTYDDWVALYPDSPGDPYLKAHDKQLLVFWWPSHRPMQVWQQTVSYKKGKDGKNEPQYHYDQVDWSRGIPTDRAGDLKMVTYWSKLGFVVSQDEDPNGQKYIETDSQV